MQTLKVSHFRLLYKNLVNYHPHTEIKSTFTTPRKSKSNSTPLTKTKSYPTGAQKKSQFRALLWTQVKLDLLHRKKVNLGDLHKKQVDFDAPTEAKPFSDPTQKTKPLSPTHTKPSQPISTLKSSDFRPAHKPRSISTPTQRPMLWYGLGRPVITSEKGNFPCSYY